MSRQTGKEWFVFLVSLSMEIRRNCNEMERDKTLGKKLYSLLNAMRQFNWGFFFFLLCKQFLYTYFPWFLWIPSNWSQTKCYTNKNYKININSSFPLPNKYILQLFTLHKYMFGQNIFKWLTGSPFTLIIPFSHLSLSLSVSHFLAPHFYFLLSTMGTLEALFFQKTNLRNSFFEYSIKIGCFKASYTEDIKGNIILAQF